MHIVIIHAGLFVCEYLRHGHHALHLIGCQVSMPRPPGRVF